MANYVNLPDERNVLRLEARGTDARRTAATEYQNFLTIKRDLDDPKSKASRNLTPKERFEETLAAQRSASAKIAAALGDPEANREALGRFAEALDMAALVGSAEFLPTMNAGAESQAHDLRVLARGALRSEYRDRIERMTPEAIIDEARRAARDAGTEPHLTPELAKLSELHRQVATQSGPAWSPARSAIIGAYSTVESSWGARAALVQSVETSARAFEVAHDYADAVRNSREPNATTRARAIAKELVDAGRC